MAVRHLLPAQPERLKPDISLFIVNIVLLMILFFLATGQIMNGTSTNERLAITQNLPLDLLPQPLLEISVAGALTLDGEPIGEGELVAKLNGSRDLFILIGADVSASRLVDFLARDDLAEVNIELVTIATRAEAQP